MLHIIIHDQANLLIAFGEVRCTDTITKSEIRLLVACNIKDIGKSSTEKLDKSKMDRLHTQGRIKTGYDPEAPTVNFVL